MSETWGAIDLPIPHPDYISIDLETMEVVIKYATVESVNSAIDMIGKLAKMEADSIAFNVGSRELWTEQIMRLLPCDHVDRATIDLSVPVAPLNFEEDEAALYIFRLMFSRKLPRCEHEACYIRNAMAEEELRNFACYTLARKHVPHDDPLWREYGPKLVDAYLDQIFFYGPEPDVETLKRHGASVPDPRQDLILWRFKACVEEIELRTTLRDWMRDGMEEDWFDRFEPDFLETRNVDIDYLTLCMAHFDDLDAPLTEEFVDEIEWPAFLHKSRREGFDECLKS